MVFTKKEVKTPKMILKLEIELNHSTKTPDEVAQRVQYAMNSYNCKSFSDFVIFLLRESQSSTYDLKSLTIEEVKS